MTRICIGGPVALFVAILGGYSVMRSFAQPLSENTQPLQKNGHLHEELPALPWMPRPSVPPPGVEIRCEPVVLGDFRSVQVNVDAFGCNIGGDAANEPSIAIDPSNPRRITIGWRQFDSVVFGMRQAGFAYSHDGGYSWIFPGVLRRGVFGSDPVLGADSMGRFFYLTLEEDLDCSLFRSTDGGLSWLGPVLAYGWDKPWMVVDQSGGIGGGNIYVYSAGIFARSVDHGESFQEYSGAGSGLSNMAVGSGGEVFLGRGYASFDARDSNLSPTFQQLGPIDWNASFVATGLPNPSGLLGQNWVGCDVSDGPFHGNLYALGHLRPLGSTIPPSIMFVRSEDGGLTWSEPIRINNDPEGTSVWHWFGVMSVAPNGRIDVAWNDTRNTNQANLSELFFAFSIDGGDTWLGNVPVSPVFDSHIGWPGGQSKLGDYYHMVSDNLGVNIAYAATFNGEQDIYFLRIGPYDCNGNEVPDENDITDGTSLDCNSNDMPDECEYRGDFNGDRLTGLDDHAAYIACRTDPGGPIGAPCCGLFDIEPDGDADLADFAFVQRAFISQGP